MTKTTTPLRKRRIEDMTIRKLAPRTQQGYIRSVKEFGAFFGAKTSAGDDPTTVTLSFYDTSNHMIGSAQ